MQNKISPIYQNEHMQRKLEVFKYKIGLNKDFHHLEAKQYKPNTFQESNFEGKMRSHHS